MGYVLGFVCVLALGLMGCSETSCPECGGDGGIGGDGGAAGIGGDGGNGGGGEPVTDCTGVGAYEDCIINGNAGVCDGDICVAIDCSGLERGTKCATYEFGGGFCETDEDETVCLPAVSDCAGIENGTRCRGHDHHPTHDWLGWVCVEGICYAGEDCNATGPGDPCLVAVGDPSNPGIGFDDFAPGICSVHEVCFLECELLEEGAECLLDFGGPTGTCEGGECVE